MARLWIGLGALAGLLAVAMAALAAHGLESIGPARLGMVRSALQMQGWHALALLACGLWAPRGGRLVDWAGGAFVAGLVAVLRRGLRAGAVRVAGRDAGAGRGHAADGGVGAAGGFGGAVGVRVGGEIKM